MKRHGSIYLITNLLSGKKYIGQTIKCIFSRFNEHCRDNRSSRYLSVAIKKHGRENFKVEELFCSFDKQSLNFYESYFIVLHNSFSPNGYNLSMGEDRKGEVSKETREKMRVAKLGKTVNRIKGWSFMSRFRKSRAQNGRYILATEIATERKTIYIMTTEPELYGFNPKMVSACCNNKYGRKSHKGYTWQFISEQVNQSGSEDNKLSLHAQRIEGEPAKAEYNPSTSPQLLQKVG